MKVARCLAEAVALNGKIYVMGGVNNDEGGPEPWAEVFDPQSGKWVSLDGSTHLLRILHLAVCFLRLCLPMIS